MASPVDLLTTPLSSGHSSSGTLSSLAGQSVVQEEDESESESESETSPCAAKAARRKRKLVYRQFALQNSSPLFAELLRKIECPLPSRNLEPELRKQKESTIAVTELPDNEDSPEEAEPELPDVQEVEVQEIEDTDAASDEEEEEEEEEPTTTTTTTPLPSLTPPSKIHTIHEIIKNMSDTLTKSYNDDKPGYAYVLFDRHGRSPLIKIGNSHDVKIRLGRHRRSCKLENWDLRHRPAMPISRPKRLEFIAQAELQSLNCIPDCACNVKHKEYFRASKEVGIELLNFWARWLQTHQPYNEHGKLKHFWTDRLNHFKDNVSTYFRCGRAQCARNANTDQHEDEDVPACQACLRAGWKRFAEPDLLDTVNHVFQRGLCFWWWLSNPVIFICAIELRFLVRWAVSNIQLPLSSDVSLWALTVVDIGLFSVGIHTYSRIQALSQGLKDAKGSPERSKKTKGPSLGGSPRQSNGQGESGLLATTLNPLRASNASGTRRGRRRVSA